MCRCNEENWYCFTRFKRSHHSQKKQITLIVLEQLCMPRSGIYDAVQEQSVLNDRVLSLEETGRYKDLRYFLPNGCSQMTGLESE